MKPKFTYVDHKYPPLDSRPFPDYEPFGMKDMVDNYSLATRLLYRYPRTVPRPFGIVVGRGCPFACLPGDTLIKMYHPFVINGGTKPLSQIQVGDKVLSKSMPDNVFGSLEESEVTSIRYYNSKPLLRISVTFDEFQLCIKCTPDHQLLSLVIDEAERGREQWLPAENLKKGDMVEVVIPNLSGYYPHFCPEVHFATITNIEAIPAEPVYDIETIPNHNFIADGFIVHNCTFCIDHHRQYRVRSTENIIAEIKEMYERYKFNILIILDELFAINKARMKEFCAAIMDGKAKYGWDFDWCFQTHANARLDLESLKMAKEAGCYFFSYGLESASPAVLKSMDKHLKLAQIVEAIDLAGKAKIGFGGNLIFGDPAETEHTMTESIDFYFRHCQTEEVFLGVMIPYPGSKIFDYCIENKIITDKASYYETCKETVYNMTKLPTEVLNHWLYMTQYIEHSWGWISRASDVKWEEIPYTDKVVEATKNKMYRATGKCPHCGDSVEYHQPFPNLDRRVHLGVGCTHCGRRIRLNLGGKNG